MDICQNHGVNKKGDVYKNQGNGEEILRTVIITQIRFFNSDTHNSSGFTFESPGDSSLGEGKQEKCFQENAFKISEYKE